MAVSKISHIKNAITYPKGFSANGLHCGFKKNNALDLGLLKGSGNTTSAAVFTKNLMKAHPVVITQNNLKISKGKLEAIVVNSGNANALNGQKGLNGAKQIINKAAKFLNIEPSKIGICSTGLIGIEFPYHYATNSFEQLVTGLSPLNGELFSRAILTTDSRSKSVLYKGNGFCIAGVAKGAGMIAPNMATMLAFITTDVVISYKDLQKSLSEATKNTFNLLTIDGATSTNDTVIALASNLVKDYNYAEFNTGVQLVLKDLAIQIAKDAEGATKIVWVTVKNAPSYSQGQYIGKRIAQSVLIKASFFGSDPYWGRIAAEIGASALNIEPKKVEIFYGNHLVFKNLAPVKVEEKLVNSYMAKKEIEVICDLHAGRHSVTILTTDLGFNYIKENMGRS